MVERLDKALFRLGESILHQMGIDVRDVPESGAVGGMALTS